MASPLLPWAVELGLITVRDIWGKNATIGGLKIKGTPHTVGGLPAPGDYLATAVIFGPLALARGTRFQTLAALVGWGYVLATLLNILDPSDPLNRGQGPSTQTTAAGAPTGGGTAVPTGA
jgi:hypothetical protein